MTENQIREIGENRLHAATAHVESVKQIYKSKEATAKMLGIGGAQVYDFLNKAYDRIGIETFDRIERQYAKLAWQFVETTNARVIKAAMRAAVDNLDMYGIIGDTGTGKTFASEYYTQDMGNIRIMADAMMTQTDFLDAIIIAANMRTYNARSKAAKMTLVCRLIQEAKTPLLVIDDAGKLPETCLKLIQIIYDRTRGKVGILLIGTETLYTRIVQHAENNRHFMRELFGRITHWHTLGYAEQKDIETICNENGIVDETAKTWLYNATASLHTLSGIIRKAIKVGTSKNVQITADILAKMNNNLKWNDKHFMNFKNRAGI